MEPRRYPIDYAALEIRKGSVITNQQVADALGVDPSDVAAVQLAKLRIREDVRSWFMARGEIVTITTPKDGVRVLTDPEALEYNDGAFGIGMRKMAEANIRMRAVDPRALSDAERRRQEHQVLAQSHILQAMRVARREARRLSAGSAPERVEG